MDVTPFRAWISRKRLQLLVLGILVLSCIAGLVFTPQFLSAYAANSTKLLSQGHLAVASSTETFHLNPEAAVDGKTNTRWSSAYSDPQWLAIDLGNTVNISRVVLQWETAYAKQFKLQVSENGTKWTTIYTQAAGHGGTEDISASGKGRYIRMYGTQRGTKYGYSLWEFKVYGHDGTAASTPTTTESTPTVPESTPTATGITPTPTSESGTSPSGQNMPQGDIPGWHQVFTEDFNTDVTLGNFPGTAYDNKFTVYQDGWPDTAGQLGSPSKYYPSKVVSVKNGMLNLYLHTENGTPMGAAILPILKNHSYGRYTIRFKSDSLKGFKTAWLLWPDSQNGGISAKDGEIDFPEGDLDGTINGFMHPRDGSDQDAFDSGTTYTSWHTATLEWSPGKVRFILDDKVVGVSTRAIPNVPMQWVIQTESCLDGCPSPSTRGNLQIDWAVAYDPA